MYVIKRTTVYLPEDLKAELERVARECERSEADLIREGVALAVERASRPRPRFPLFASGQPGDYSRRVDELLAGMGED